MYDLQETILFEGVPSNHISYHIDKTKNASIFINLYYIPTTHTNTNNIIETKKIK